jgi:hypothetical protein
MRGGPLLIAEELVLLSLLPEGRLRDKQGRAVATGLPGAILCELALEELVVHEEKIFIAARSAGDRVVDPFLLESLRTVQMNPRTVTETWVRQLPWPQGSDSWGGAVLTRLGMRRIIGPAEQRKRKVHFPIVGPDTTAALTARLREGFDAGVPPPRDCVLLVYADECGVLPKGIRVNYKRSKELWKGVPDDAGRILSMSCSTLRPAARRRTLDSGYADVDLSG